MNAEIGMGMDTEIEMKMFVTISVRSLEVRLLLGVLLLNKETSKPPMFQIRSE